MKYPKSEPYQRSRHRSALHALVFAATAVAAIGLPTSATAIDRSATNPSLTQGEPSPELQAQRVASYWIEALQAGDQDAALSWMHMPQSSSHQQAVQADLEVLSDMLTDQNVRVEPVAHRHAGHWALSAWAMDQPDVAMAPVIEPIMLYNPASDGLFDRSADWQIVPQGMNSDSALKPLYNADYDALVQWSASLM